jgi:hypothetical protein
MLGNLDEVPGKFIEQTAHGSHRNRKGENLRRFAKGGLWSASA